MSPDFILKEVSDESGVSCDDILSKKRTAYVVACRWKVIKNLRALGMSTPEIGRFLNRDHTTIIHALQNMKP